MKWINTNRPLVMLYQKLDMPGGRVVRASVQGGELVFRAIAAFGLSHFVFGKSGAGSVFALARISKLQKYVKAATGCDTASVNVAARAVWRGPLRRPLR